MMKERFYKSMQALSWVCVQLGQCAAKMWPQFLEMEDKVVLERISASDKVSLKFGEVEVAPTTKDQLVSVLMTKLIRSL